ncbi:GIY-YIG nuclease family protein [Sphingomonas fennica]|uniref:Bacteriophage T5 Orf172 DNA-binding domain-containing protein n=1 Tax=Edaphosphingomonas fennica TaxID=114404 RepID=A0A2T4HVT6_9SPHN|nr:GIY-YIG nuclease family protein [Sphingomonas fennica]PTD19916.1 hypothetical protein CV103_12055 [Sphingomonas fennica]
MSKRPSFQFYPPDWRNDPGLRLCSIAARGLWIEMMCLMHDATPYGHLTVLGRPLGPEALARLVGEGVPQVRRWLAELEANQVYSVDGEGVIFSRRMVRDEMLRDARAAGGAAGAEHGHKGAEFGKLGGNPHKKELYNQPGKLYAVQRDTGGPIKIGVTKYPHQRFNGLRKKVGPIIILGTFDVADMGRSEAAVHACFDGRREGEWIDAEWDEVRGVIMSATHPPLGTTTHPAPSSSSSSPSPSPISSDANASGGDAPPKPSAIDLQAAIFASGVRLLCAAGKSDAQARQLIGLWKRDHGNAAVMEALASAEAEGTPDPVSFITGKLRAPHGKRNHFDRPSGPIESRRRAREQCEVDDGAGADGLSWP